jgi:hypothetical protein
MPVVIHDLEITAPPVARGESQSAGAATSIAEAEPPAQPTAAVQRAELDRRERALRVFAH